MERAMKHRVKTFLKGLGWLLGGLALWLFSLIFVGENPTGMGALGVIAMTLAGIVLIAKSCFPTKYERRQCANCEAVTEQFQTKRESKQLKYMCENCGREIVVPLCKTCRTPMELIDKDSEQWYCTKDGLLLYAKENRTVENVRLDSKSAPEQAVGKLEPRSPTTSEPARPSEKSKSWKAWLSQPIGAKKAPKATQPSQPEEPPKKEAMPTKFCRFCGARIVRDSVFCEECGAKLT